MPEDNFYRRLIEILNLHWLYKETKKYYGTEGQQSIDPVVFYKLILIGYLENLGSDRSMKQETKNYIGVDVSNFTLDVSFIRVINWQRQEPNWKQVANNGTGLKELKLWLKSHGIILVKNTVLLMEKTGVYHRHLWKFCNVITDCL